MKMREIEKIYLDKLRKMRGEDRMKITSSLHQTIKKIAIAGIISQNPDIDEEGLKRELKRRFYK